MQMIKRKVEDEMQKTELKKIVEHFNTDETIALTQRMIQIPSIDPPGNEQEMSLFVQKYLEEAGIAVESVAVEGLAPERKNIIAKLRGSGEAAPLIFSGHMDVVPVSERERQQWECDPFVGEIKDGFLWGRGASDMKGGLAGILTAMKYLKENNIVPPGDILLAASVDEENLMRGAKAMVQYPALQAAKGIIVCEGTGLELIADSRGRTWAEVVFEGKSAHASLKGAGNNAIVHAIRFADRLLNHSIPFEYHVLLGEFFWQINVIRGGVEPAMVPDQCVLTVDARLVPGITPELVWREVQLLLDQMHEEDENCVAHIDILEAREPWSTNMDSPVVDLVRDSYDFLELPMGRRGQKGTTDGTFLRRMGIDTVMIGPGDSKYNHKANEKAPVEFIRNAARLYLTMMLCNQLS